MEWILSMQSIRDDEMAHPLTMQHSASKSPDAQALAVLLGHSATYELTCRPS